MPSPIRKPDLRRYPTTAGACEPRSHSASRPCPDWGTDDWGLDGDAEGSYEDLDAFLHRADELAHSLLEQGITGMKIWPFDHAAVESDGYYISARDLDRALRRFRQQCRSSKLSRLTIECIERIGSGPPCCGRDHVVGETRPAPTVTFCRPHHIVGRLELKLFGSHKLFKDRRNTVSGEPIGPIEHP